MRWQAAMIKPRPQCEADDSLFNTHTHTHTPHAVNLVNLTQIFSSIAHLRVTEHRHAHVCNFCSDKRGVSERGI